MYGQTENASFAYCTWLEAGGSIEAVATALLAWVDAHGQTKNAQFVYRAWLEAEGALEPIIEHVVRSVETWSHEPDFVYLSKILTKQRDLPEAIVLAIAGWCEAFPEHEDCLYRISSLVSHLSEEALSVAGRSALLECIATIASSRDYWSIPDRRLIWTLCQSLVGRGHYYNLDPIGTIRSVCSIVTRGAVFGRDLSDGGVHYLAANHGMQVMLVRQGLKLGMLHLERDKRGLARFAAWLRAYAPAYLQRLQAEFPSDTWQSAKS